MLSVIGITVTLCVTVSLVIERLPGKWYFFNKMLDGGIQTLDSRNRSKTTYGTHLTYLWLIPHFPLRRAPRDREDIQPQGWSGTFRGTELFALQVS